MEHLLAVDDFSELAEVMPGSADTVYVAGHQSPGDGGAGVFRWLADSREPPNAGTVVAANHHEAGRWHRLESAPINVRWFGARGDGADATKPLQAALDAAQQGGTVYLPSGRYAISGPLRLYQGTTFRGDGLMSQLHYTGPAKTGCLQSASPEKNCPFHISGMNIEVHTEEAWGVDLRGMSFGRFDHLSIHLRRANTSGYYGPGDGQSPYYNVFTACHVAGTGDARSNGCTAFNLTYDTENQYQSANANQVFGGHINTCQQAVVCYGTGNVFYGQVIEDCGDAYTLDLPPGRLKDSSKGTVNDVIGCYTEYVRRVIVQRHENCYVTAQLAMTTGYERVFDAVNTSNCVVITSHDGRLESSRSLFHRVIDAKRPD